MYQKKIFYLSKKLIQSYLKKMNNFPKKKYKKFENADFPMLTNSLLNCNLISKKLNFRFTTLNKIIKSIY